MASAGTPADASRLAKKTIEADYDIDDDGSSSISSSYVTSIASSIRRGVEENGRIYPSLNTRHLAVVPVDESEAERNDLQHCKLFLLYDKRLHFAPIGDTPGNVLDLGTGTGIWAIDMADLYPSANIIGVDLAPTEVSWTPSNVEFELDDIENPWTWPRNHFDFIHGRELLYAIRDWPTLIQQTFDHLKPGGWAEFGASTPLIGCDDDSFPQGTGYARVGEIAIEISERVNASVKAPLEWEEQMKAAGFVDIQFHRLKIPSSPWPKDKRLKQIGAFELVNFREGIINLLLRGWVGVMGRKEEDLRETLDKASAEVGSRKMHTYISYYIALGRKPT